MMSRSSRAIALAATLAFLGSCAKAPVATDVGKDLAKRFQPPAAWGLLADTIPAWGPEFVTKGCYRTKTGDQLKIRVYTVRGNDWTTWNRIMDNELRECNYTARWQSDLTDYYWTEVKPNPPGQDVLMILWLNITKDEWGYTIIRNSGVFMYTYTNNVGPAVPLPDGEKKVYRWHTGGTEIDIGVFNPKDEGDWNPNDIQFQINAFDEP